MKSIFKKIGYGLIGIIILMILSIVILESFFEKQVGTIFLNGINKRLVSNIEVQELDLSLLSTFPHGQINFKNVRLRGTQESNSTLLEARSLKLKFALSSIISRKYKVTSIETTDGALVIKYDKTGKSNYAIFKANESAKSLQFGLSVKEARFRDIELIYSDEQLETEILWNLEDVRLEGNFSDKKLELVSFSEIESHFVEFPDGRYFAGTNLAYDAVVEADLVARKLTIKEMDLAVDASSFSVQGMVERSKDHSNIDLEVVGKDCSIKTVYDVLPSELTAGFSKVNSWGNFHFNGSIKGTHSSNENPSIQFDFGLNEGRIKHPDVDYELKGVVFSGFITNGKSRSSEDSKIVIEDFAGTLLRKPIDLSFSVQNFSDPELDLLISGDISCKGLPSLLGLQNVESGKGFLKLDSLHAKGMYGDLIDPTQIDKFSTSGTIGFDNAGLTLNDIRSKIEYGTIKLDDGKIIANDLKIVLDNSNMTLSGEFSNLIPYILRDSISKMDEDMRFFAEVKGTEFSLNDFITAAGGFNVSSQDADSTSNGTILGQWMLEGIDGELRFDLMNFRHEEIEIDTLVGMVSINNDRLNMQGVNISAFEGHMLINGIAQSDEFNKIDVYITGNELNIDQLFEQTGNFGQQMLTHKNVKGKLNLRANIKAFWDENGMFREDLLHIISDVNLDDGELVNFGMMNMLSSYVNVNDLRRIKFTTLKNQFAIMDGALYIPTMFVQNNAMNLVVSGKQRFDGRVKYLFKVNAGQVLWNKIKKHKSDLQPKKAKKKGFINVYAVVEGSSENYSFERGKKNYNDVLSNLEGRFKYIRKNVQDNLGGSEILEPDEWSDDPAGGLIE